MKQTLAYTFSICAIAFALPDRAAADDDQCAMCFLPGSGMGGVTEGYSGEHSVYESVDIMLEAHGGSGQTGGGVDDLMYASVDVSLFSHGGDGMADRVVFQAEYNGWMADVDEGYIYAGADSWGPEVWLTVADDSEYHFVGSWGDLQLCTESGAFFPIQEDGGIVPAGSYRLEFYFGSDTSPGTELSYASAWRWVFAKRGDVDGDGTVGVDDLLQLLAVWGECTEFADCVPDYDGDGTVGVADLLTVLSEWG